MLLRDYIGRCAATYPAEVAYVTGAVQRTWSETHARTDHLAGALQQLGLAKGDSVGILSHNRIEIAEHWLSCLKAGMVRCGINWRYSAREILHAIRDSDCRAIIIQSECAEAIAPYLDELRTEGRIFIGFSRGHEFEQDYESLIGQEHAALYPPLTRDDRALIGYTSGSTGLPKGVILTQGNVFSNVTNLSIGWGFSYEDVRLYCTNPAGVNVFMTCMNIVTGMKTVIEDFEAETFFDLVVHHKITQVTLVPTMLRRVIDLQRSGHHDVSSLRQILYGSMPTSPAMIRQAYDTLDCGFTQIYGASESGGPITVLRNADHLRALRSEPDLLTSVGRILPHALASVRDDEGNVVPMGETGTVWLGGDSIMAGYLNRPEETKEALVDGWQRTGDFGRMDERGYIFLGDRKKNMIISGGMNVHPLGIENVLAEHPAVSQAVVVGVPHPDWGEAVAAVVTLKAGATTTEAELIAHCKTSVPRWEVPKHITISARLPQGFTDKLDKRAIRDSLIESGRLPWTLTT